MIIWAIIPNIIKKILATKPINLENIFEINVLKNSPMSNILGYCQLYLRQGEKIVIIKLGTEKKYNPNQR